MRRGPEHLGRVLVLGLGKSGKSVARYCASLLGTRVDALFVAAGARTDDSVAFVNDCNTRLAPVAEAPVAEVEYAFGDDALEGDVGRFDLCIASPGIPFWHELYVRGAELSGELISEVEFAWRESDETSTWVAITGTNGKTTTTSLAAHVLRECGLAADAVGNIGEVCLDAVAAGRTQVYVAEVSSYQLHSTRLFAPDVAVMLNITPDHIHWHKTLEAYRDAKFKVIDHMQHRGSSRESSSAQAQADRSSLSARHEELECSGGELKLARSRWKRATGSFPGRSTLRNSPASQAQTVLAPAAPSLVAACEAASDDSRLLAGPVVILDATNDVVREKVRELKAMTREQRGFDYVPMGTSEGIRSDMRAKCGAENAAFIGADDALHVALRGVDHVLADVADLQIKGEHNASNALAAAAVAVALGADDAGIAAALASFEPLVHRIEPCGTVAGAACYNDSKATNVDATLKALAAFPGKRVIIMLGGDDKGTDLAELVAATYAHAAAAVCYGEGGPRFADALEQAPGGRFASSDVAQGGRTTGEAERKPDACSDACSGSDGLRIVRAAHMEDAFDAALDLACPGDVVLLSPACASFDEFRSFEQRGDVFKQLVADRAAVRGA